MNSLYFWQKWKRQKNYWAAALLPHPWFLIWFHFSRKQIFFPFSLLEWNLPHFNYHERVTALLYWSISLSLSGHWTTVVTFPLGLIFCTSLILLSIWSCFSLYYWAGNVATEQGLWSKKRLTSNHSRAAKGSLFIVQKRAVIFCRSCFGFTSWSAEISNR